MCYWRYLVLLCPFILFAQNDTETLINKHLLETLNAHRAFVSIPNLPEDRALMLKNISWVEEKYKALDFKTRRLESTTLPILFVTKEYDPSYKTILFYVHIDGQPVNTAAWDQEDPFTPILKERGDDGAWHPIPWERLEASIDEEWRVFGRAAADDKAPIMMFLTALQLLEKQNKKPRFNIKIIFDPEEEYNSTALLSTLEKYKHLYEADYFIVMDGPAHDSNRPTLTFGCRGIATASITTYGGRLPQHSGHFGNYAPNPVFTLARLLATIKDEQGRVLIDGYYDGITITPETSSLLNAVPYNAQQFNKELGIHEAEKVGRSYQEALQYPSLNIRQIGTSWTGKGLKTVVPEYAVAQLDVRLVPEIDGDIQLEKIQKHLEGQGYHVIDRAPTNEERLSQPKIVTFTGKTSVNAFRTDVNSVFGKIVRESLTIAFDQDPILIRMMGGTVPIVPLINTLNIPTIIVPMVNMDNNQHNPNENIRIGNIKQGIKMCMSLLETSF